MTYLISPEYAKLNREMHMQKPDYGAHGNRWTDQVKMLVNQYQPKVILDYGCGKQTLTEALKLQNIVNYDPGMPGLDDPPKPADLVVCTDVLEHIEPECIDAVLNHLQSLTYKALFVVVATRPAVKQLPDGRNAHLIQEAAEWWLERLQERMSLKSFEKISAGEFMAVMEPK